MPKSLMEKSLVSVYPHSNPKIFAMQKSTVSSDNSNHSPSCDSIDENENAGGKKVQQEQGKCIMQAK